MNANLPPPPSRTCSCRVGSGRRDRAAREAPRPAHQGRDHAGRVRREEGRAAQPALVRVVSLVPSVTETLLAWDVVPIAVTRFCEHPELPHVGGTKDPDVDRIVSLAAGPRGGERRGEPQGGLRRARSRRPRGARRARDAGRGCCRRAGHTRRASSASPSTQRRFRPRCRNGCERSSRSGVDRG